MPNESISISVVLADNMSASLSKIGNGFVTFTRQAEKAQKKLEPFGKALGLIGSAAKKHAAEIQHFGTRMGLAGGAITGALLLMEHAAAEFEQQMANVSTMLDEQTLHYMPAYEEEIKNLSISMGESTSTLSKGLYDILSASIDASKAMGVLEASAIAAKGGLTSTAVSADAITTVLNAYQLSAEKATEVSDKLFAIVKRGKLTYADLAPNIGKVATLAASAGLSFNELGAAIATLTRAGLNTEEAMTAIRGVLNSFLSPADESAKVAAELEFELNTATLRGGGLIEVFKKLAGASAEQVAALVPNVRALVGLQGILQQSAGYTYDLSVMMNSAGMAQVAFEKNTKTSAFAMDQLKAALQIARIELGTALAPTIIKLSEKIVKYVLHLREWINENREFLEQILGITFQLGKFLIVFGVLTNITGRLITLWVTLGKTAVALNTFMGALNLTTKVFTTSATGLAGALGAVGLIAAGLVIIYSNYKSGIEKVEESQKQTNTTMSKTVGILKENQTAWNEYAAVVENANEKMSMATKKAVIEKNITDLQRTLADTQTKINENSGYFDKANRELLIKDRATTQKALEMNRQALKDLSTQWTQYVEEKKKKTAEANAPEVVGIVTQEMKTELEKVENEIIALRDSKREADIASLEKWFKEQQVKWKGHTKELATIEEYYNLQRAEFNKQAAEDVIKELDKERKEREKSIEIQNELAKSGVVSFGDAQSKNRQSLELLNQKIDESKEKIRELFVDSPELAKEFIAKIDESTVALQRQEDQVGQVFTGFQAGIRNATDGMTRWADIGVKAGEMVASTISEDVSDAFVEAIRGTKDFGTAMREMASSVLADLAKMIIKAMILRSVMAVMGFNEGGEVAPIERAEGGPIPGPNVNRDIIPAKLTPGEYVHRREAVDYYGSGIMSAINNMLIPKPALAFASGRIGNINHSGMFASGGQVGSSRSSSPSPAYVVANEQTLDRLLSGGNSAMINWMSANKGTLRAILG